MRITLKELRQVVRSVLCEDAWSNSRAWWITPEGQTTSVPYNGEHDDVARELLKLPAFDENATSGKWIDRSAAADEYVEMGAIRIRKQGNGKFDVEMNNSSRNFIKMLDFLLEHCSPQNTVYVVAYGSKCVQYNGTVDELSLMSYAEFNRSKAA